jgi:hypothetical protein
VTVDPAPSTEPTQASPATGGGRRAGISWNWLLVIPLIGTLIPAFYNRATPKLFSIPFFYWYQLLWIPITVALTLVVFRASRETREAGHE